MRAFAVRGFGEAPSLWDLPEPDEEDSYIIRVTDAGVNPVDAQLVQQLSKDSTYPFVVGVDMAGVLESVPPGESTLKVGDRVFGMARSHGAYADRTAVPVGARTEPIAVIPVGVWSEQAAALPVAGICALGSLDLLSLTEGESLVVIGGAGAVGGYTLQIARSRSLHIVAVVRGSVEEAISLGADEVVDTRDREMVEAIRSLHPHGVDAVIDVVNGRDKCQRDADLLKKGGSLVSTTYGADIAWFRERKISAFNIVGHGDYPESTVNPLQTREGLDLLARLLLEGVITTRVSRTATLDGAPQIFEELRTRELGGKAVIHVNQRD